MKLPIAVEILLVFNILAHVFGLIFFIVYFTTATY